VERAAFQAELGSLGLSPTDDLLDHFEQFEERLYQANAVMNLTRVSREEAWIRHFLDSLLFHDLIEPGSEVLDIGTGPGFPAWPLALARPDLRVSALDSSCKMLGFLRQSPLPNLEIVEARAEEWGVRERYRVVTGRALAPLATQLELSAAPCVIGGRIIPMRTPTDRATIDALDPAPLGLRLARVVERILPVLEAPRMFPIYEKVRATPARYPRSWPEIKRQPIGGRGG